MTIQGDLRELVHSCAQDYDIVAVAQFGQRLAELEAQARRYRFIRGMVQIEPDSPEGEALNEILERPDLQPPEQAEYSQEAFDAQYDAMLAAASEKCPTIAAALNMEI